MPWWQFIIVHHISIHMSLIFSVSAPLCRHFRQNVSHQEHPRIYVFFLRMNTPQELSTRICMVKVFLGPTFDTPMDPTQVHPPPISKKRQVSHRGCAANCELARATFAEAQRIYAAPVVSNVSSYLGVDGMMSPKPLAQYCCFLPPTMTFLKRVCKIHIIFHACVANFLIVSGCRPSYRHRCQKRSYIFQATIPNGVKFDFLFQRSWVLLLTMGALHIHLEKLYRSTMCG